MPKVVVPVFTVWKKNCPPRALAPEFSIMDNPMAPIIDPLPVALAAVCADPFIENTVSPLTNASLRPENQLRRPVTKLMVLVAVNVALSQPAVSCAGTPYIS